ncbi:NUDIX domain-containing protein [Streptomyces panaciradicis]|uniref:NUDIX domain-containing protein n=1 Tax=Streptomyces panaciradicis TaxID=1470261 RepID=UPI00201CD5AA|nr:NUDIX domain-containing protein [Streptomyces panaciradicis]MCL6668660.1 NUDIX domain-containing protein [Streptomyces panaciradicis]
MPRGEAIVAILRRGDRLLAVRRGPGVVRPGYWQPLSGKVEPGESQPEAVVREVREEVGLTAAPLAKVWESETDDGRFRLHWWTADASTGDVVPDPDEVGDFRWVTPEEFLALAPVFDGDREFFTHVLPNLEP